MTILSSSSVAGLLVWLGFSVLEKNNDICYVSHRGSYEGKTAILVEIILKSSLM